MKQTQSGRTMVEILGILAVMGIFTVVGMQLYAKAMNTIRVNHLMEMVYLVANEVRNESAEKHRGKMVDLPSAKQTLAYGFSFPTDNDNKPQIRGANIEIKVSGAFTSKICDLLTKKLPDYENDGLKEIVGVSSCDGSVKTITFKIDSSLKKVVSALAVTPASTPVDPTNGCRAGGYYSAGGECKQVEPGYYATGGRKILCPNGKVSGIGYSACVFCPEGSYEEGHKICKECEAGNYCTSGVKRVCSAGTISANGASSCGPCGEGSYASYDHTECKVCEAGSYCTGGIKRTCGSGKISVAGSTSCSTCDSGKYASSDHTECKSCDAGSYCTGGIKRTCGSGTYSNAGQSSCSTCGSGTYASSDHKSCVTCTAGNYCVNGLQNPCPSGKTSAAGASSCVCANGKYASGNNCVTCVAGNYCTGGVSHSCPTGTTSSAGASSCTTCGNGTYVSGNSCVTCEAGNYCTGGVKQGCSGNTISSSGASSCTACTGSTTASTKHTACLSCDQYQIIGETACQDCPAGKKPNTNSTSCEDCSDGEECAGCVKNKKYNDRNWHKYWNATKGVCVQCTTVNDPCSHDLGFYCVKNSCCTAGNEGNYAQSSANCSAITVEAGYYLDGWEKKACVPGNRCPGGSGTGAVMIPCSEGGFYACGCSGETPVPNGNGGCRCHYMTSSGCVSSCNETYRYHFSEKSRCVTASECAQLGHVANYSNGQCN